MEQDAVAVYKDQSDGVKLYVKYWIGPNEESRGTLLIAHGLGETADYYDEISRLARARQFNVIVPELRGHGRTAGDITSLEYSQSGGNPGPDSLHKMADDIATFAAETKTKFSEKPVFLLGHSMGSLVAQLAVTAHGELFDGLILTGLPSAGEVSIFLKLIDAEIGRRGLKATCEDTFHALFDNANQPFEPIKTPLDWITSDEAMARKSLALPYTSVLFTNEFYRDFFRALSELQEPARWQSTSTCLPVLLLSGENDVMAQGGKSAEKTLKMLKSLGFSDVHTKTYTGLRHSILRETARDRVMDDIFHWMELRLKIRMCRA